MIQSITKNQFSDAFHSMGRGDAFSYHGLNSLYDYLIQLEDDCDMDIELDVIELCCEYSEYDLNECLDYYKLSSIKQLSFRTSVILVESMHNTIIIQDF